MSGVCRKSIAGLGLALAPLGAAADPTGNVFFGFDLVLAPLAIKAACGADIAPDLAQVTVLIAAYPEDAAAADIQEATVSWTAEPTGYEALAKILGAEPSKEKREEICQAAISLSLTWVTPESLASAARSMPADQETAWAAFYDVVQSP